jgi:hypothetical protein
MPRLEQEPGRGFRVHVGAVAPFLHDQGAAELQVEGRHVEAGNPLGAGAGQVEHPLQQPFARRMPVVGKRPFEPGEPVDGHDERHAGVGHRLCNGD